MEYFLLYVQISLHRAKYGENLRNLILKYKFLKYIDYTGKKCF